MKGPSRSSAGPSPQPFVRRAVLFLVWAERIVFFAIGLLLFLAAAALMKESVGVLFAMFAGGDVASASGSRFLDVVLLVLMIVELAYTVILSLRGSVLQAEPFLIVGLIAVIRRILVITVGDATNHGPSLLESIMELGILTVVIVVFVGAIALLRVRPKRDEFADEDPLRDRSDV